MKKRSHRDNDAVLDQTGIHRRTLVGCLRVVMVLTFLATALQAQNQPQAAQGSGQENATAHPPTPAQTAFPTPSIVGPLQAAPANTFKAGPFGKLNFNGLVSGMGLWQGNPLLGDNSANGALNNGRLFLQKTTSWWRFYVQAGVYNIPALGTPFIATERTVFNLYGPVPVAYANFVPTKSTSIMVGSLPTLMGAEHTFDFRNMNVERGLLWNQENAINRGIQVNQTLGKFTASLAWNDGFYSNRYSWLSGSLTYASGPHNLVFAAMENLGQTAFRTLATPVQNNSSMYALVYAYAKRKWIVQPYFQYTTVPTNSKAGITNGNSTWGGAALLSRTFSHGFSLAGRVEYITSTGSSAQRSVNLLYGPGSAAWSLTLTPTYQHKRFFTRAEISSVRANGYTPGDVFGPAGLNPNQARGVIEAGFLF